MAGFVQIIEFQTSRLDEIKALLENYQVLRQSSPDAQTAVAPVRATTTADRDRPGYYLNIVEFDSAEAATENSNRPDTSEFAAQMMELCDAPPKFYNLDVLETWTR